MEGNVYPAKRDVELSAMESFYDIERAIAITPRPT